MNNYISQYGQDQFLDKILFRKKKNGTFVDIGANDGITISNTYYFEKYLGWKGICFEPLNNAFKQLEQNRTSINIHGCASDWDGVDTFYAISGYGEMLSGLKSQYDDKHLERIEKTIAEHGGEITQTEINCYNVTEALVNNNFINIDFISIDTEGGELNIIKALDFSKLNIKVIVVENNYNDASTLNYLQTRGYKLFHRLDCDEVFIHPKNFGVLNLIAAKLTHALFKTYKAVRITLAKINQ